MRVSRIAPFAIVWISLGACKDSAHVDSETETPEPDIASHDAPPTAPPSVASAAPQRQEDLGPPAVQLIGRFDERDPRGPACGWPGCRIVATVLDAPSVSIKLGETVYLAGPSEWDIAIDGRLQPKLVLKEGIHEYEVARGLPPGKHTIELYKRTEAQNGVTQYLGFDFHGGTLLAPPPRRARHLEIVGDSDVSGFGYEGAVTGTCEPGPSWAARHENFRGAWGERLANKVGAELYGTCFSGKGFYYNIWRPDTETIEQVFVRADPNFAESLWDKSKWTPDVVIVAIGGNDYNIGQPQDFGPAPLEGFTRKAREFAALLRSWYPRAHIFLMAYAVLTDHDPPGRQRRTNVETALKTVTSEHNTRGDTRVYFVAPRQYVPEELTGCDGHGGPEYHERIANYLEGELRSRLGW